MKKMNVLAVAIVATMGMMVISCNQGGISGNANLKEATDSVGYAIGVSYGTGLKGQMQTLPGKPANTDALIAGFLTAIKGDTGALKITAEQANEYLNQYFMAEQAKEGEVTKAEGEAFLAANEGKAGVNKTESGLQYTVLTEGTGATPTATDQVKVHYTGKLLDGTVFDSSVQRGEPLTIGVGQVIPGWTEIMQIMPVGSKYQVWIPSDLAYGPRGSGQLIKPNSTLEFEIELLEIITPEKK
ncbi:MAG: FKBP-type peptidyl-prolyl cis-trans isomerase [Tannerella sp.]|jgi:FKBP-type peptidyl-prolyl cis-trans isomerase|nr:FKBP-type peptidyl-prolyl cis-trans isomerase [Tannerella sp.]